LKPFAAVIRFFWQSANFPRRWIGGHLARAESTSISALAKGEGAIVQIGDAKVAAYRDDRAVVHTLSPVCTHFRCIVEWNSAEKTWDCPCHGSRFDYKGKVIRGPAGRDLARQDLS
jgi:Rieske Fe-S protein